MKDKYRYFITKFIFVFLVFTADQATKYYILDHFKNIGKKFEYICSTFNLVLVWNQGVSFGFFNDYPDSNIIFLIIALLIVGFLGHLLIKSDRVLASISYILIIGGALGNIFDRIERGAVVDFLEFHYDKFYWPAFNLADSAISIGVFLMMVDIIFWGKRCASK